VVPQSILPTFGAIPSQMVKFWNIPDKMFWFTLLQFAAPRCTVYRELPYA